jgi:predicted lipoprotein with Yx(FWY)xxD motif
MFIKFVVGAVVAAILYGGAYAYSIHRSTELAAACGGAVMRQWPELAAQKTAQAQATLNREFGRCIRQQQTFLDAWFLPLPSEQ